MIKPNRARAEYGKICESCGARGVSARMFPTKIDGRFKRLCGPCWSAKLISDKYHTSDSRPNTIIEIEYNIPIAPCSTKNK